MRSNLRASGRPGGILALNERVNSGFWRSPPRAGLPGQAPQGRLWLDSSGSGLEGSNSAYPVGCQSDASVIMEGDGPPRLSDDSSRVSAGFPG